jgi:DNA-binding MarR family transcriptional regulator
MKDRERQIRALAHRVAFVVTAATAERLAEARRACLRAAPDVDPDALDRERPEYLAGAVDALTGLLGSIEEQTLPEATVRLLLKSERARILVAVVAHPGANQKQLAARLGVKEPNLAAYLRELAAAMLVEPAPADGLRGRSYALSPWGRLAWSKIVDGSLGAAVPADELAAAIATARPGPRTRGKAALVAVRDGAAAPRKRK